MTFRSWILVGGALGAGAGGMWLAERLKPVGKTADLRGLRAQLDAAAEKNLPVPSLAMRSVTVRVPKLELESQVAGVVKLAGAFGGSAREGLDRDAARVVLATLPGKGVDDFLEAVEKGSLTEVAASPGDGEMVDCEVVLSPQ